MPLPQDTAPKQEMKTCAVFIVLGGKIRLPLNLSMPFVCCCGVLNSGKRPSSDDEAGDRETKDVVPPKTEIKESEKERNPRETLDTNVFADELTAASSIALWALWVQRILMGWVSMGFAKWFAVYRNELKYATYDISMSFFNEF